MERERLRQAWTSPDLRQNTSHQLATLCTTLSEVTGAHKRRADACCKTVKHGNRKKYLYI